jgi:hypothetical protein
MARTMSGEKRRIGAATYWVKTTRDLEEAHLLAKFGRYDSLTGLVREAVDAVLADLRAQHGVTVQAALAAMGHGDGAA